MSLGSGVRRVFSLSRSRLTRYSAAILPASSFPPSPVALRPHLSAVSNHVVFHLTDSRRVHTSNGVLGLEEFFPTGEDLVEEAEKTGA